MVKQFLGYAIPSALAMCIASLNTIIDGVFLGNGIGDAALGAVNIVMPITIVFFGLATMVSVGGGALISKNFGANEDEKGISIFRQVTYMLIIMSLCLSAICVIFAKPIVKIMGATENLLPLAAEYLKYYAMFCLPSLLGIAFNSFLRNDNKPKLAMVSTICGTISNIILNYIFIFKLGLGIKSAAIATGFGQIITLLIALPHFILKKGKLSLVIVADDASDNTKKLFKDKSSFRKVNYIELSTKDGLGMSIGKDSRAVIGIKDIGFANKIVELID